MSGSLRHRIDGAGLLLPREQGVIFSKFLERSPPIIDQATDLVTERGISVLPIRQKRLVSRFLGIRNKRQGTVNHETG